MDNDAPALAPADADQGQAELGDGDEGNGPAATLLAAVLVLPAKLAVGVLSVLTGIGAARRAGASVRGSALGGILSLVALQALVLVAAGGASRRKREEEARAATADQHAVSWTDALQAVGLIVQRFSEGLSLPAGLRYVFLDKRLVRLYHAEVSARLKRHARRGRLSPTDVLVEGRHYSEYAMATYGYVLLRALGMLDPSYDSRLHGRRAIDVARYRLRLPEDAVLVSRLDGEVIGVPRHFVAVDDEKHAVVVAIRGTNSIQDVLTDLLCGDTPFAGGFAHRGMKDAANSLFEAVLPTVRAALARRPAYTLVVCGHSLGAGVALLLTKVLLDAGFAGVRCYAIAPCPVFGPRGKIDPEWSDAVECFVHGEDLVSQLCLSSARRLILEIERVDALPVSPEERRALGEEARQLTGVIDGQRRSDVRSDPREKRVQHLYIPTKRGVHWMLPEEEVVVEETKKKGGWFWRSRRRGSEKDPQDVFEDFPWGNWDIPPASRPKRKYNSFVTDVSAFDRMLVTPGSVRCHFPSSYASVFASLPIPPPVELPTPPRLGSQRTGQYFGELGQL